MHRKSYFMPFHSYISKYKSEISEYLLQDDPNEIFNVCTSTKDYTLPNEISKYIEINTISFVWKLELEEILEENNEDKIVPYIEKSLETCLPKGNPRKLLKDFFVSILKFCRKNKYDSNKTRILLVHCYNTHQYFASNLWRTPEDIYSFFKEIILCHCVLLPPDTKQVFLAKECQDILVYFHNIYIRNLPLVKLVMFPNYGYIV